VEDVDETERSALPSRGSGALGQRLGRSFARVVVVSTLACGLLLFFLVRVAGYVRHMQHDETEIRQGLELATAVREQYIHAAHTIIVGDRSHLDHYGGWVAKVHQGTTELRSRVQPADRWRLDRVDRVSVGMDRLLRDELLPAVLAGDVTRVRTLHERLDQQAELAADDADALARSFEARMSHAHVDTTNVTYVAATVAVLSIVILIGLSILSTRQLREIVLKPLGALASAARKIGHGDFQARVGLSAEGELGLVGKAFDRMAEELAAHQRRLVANERMAAIGQLAAGVAHEINNPIGVIRGYLRTMIPEADRPELKKELQILDEEATACQRIADDLVAFARSPELNKESVDLEDMLRQTAERFEASGESRGCHVQVEADEMVLQADAVRLRQVVQNLLRNAVQASPPHAPIEIVGEATPTMYFIRVRDNGSGIPPELRTRIFEPFLSGRLNGTGLGLAVCEGIVRAHRGSIEARDRVGGGTEFVVALPRARTGPESAHG
jgi:signal transduction histidine kinase